MATKKKLPKADMGAQLVNIADKIDRVEAMSDYNFKIIPLSQIALNPKNRFGMRDIEDLAESIREHGQLHNAVVREFQDPDNPEIKYQMISGERRYRARTLLGLNDIPCFIVECKNELDVEEKIIISNIKTRELNETEKMENVSRLYEIVEEKRKMGEYEGKKTREVVAEMFSNNAVKMSPATVQKFKTIKDNLIPEFMDQLEQGNLSTETANQIAQMQPELQKLTFQAFQDGITLTAKQTKELKDRLKETEEGHDKVISDMTEALKKKDAELKDAKAEAEEHAEKLKSTVIENETLKKRLEDTQFLLQKAKDEQKAQIEQLEKEKNKIKEDIEENLRDQIGDENNEELEALKRKLEDAEAKQDEIKSEYEDKIKEYEEQLRLQQEQQEEKQVEVIKIEGNVAIKHLAKLAQKAVNDLFEKINEYKDMSGFEMDEDTEKAILEIFEKETKLKGKKK